MLSGERVHLREPAEEEGDVFVGLVVLHRLIRRVHDRDRLIRTSSCHRHVTAPARETGRRVQIACHELEVVRAIERLSSTVQLADLMQHLARPSERRRLLGGRRGQAGRLLEESCCLTRSAQRGRPFGPDQ